MRQRTSHCICTLFAVALTSAITAFAQSSDLEEPITAPPTTPAPALIDEPAAQPATPGFEIALPHHDGTWEAAQTLAPKKGKIVVVTFDEPKRRHTCRIRSFTADKLVCARAVGEPRTYLPEQVAELIIPGDDALRIPLFLGLNAGLSAAIWGTVVLAAVCPPCAVGTGIAALVFFSFAGAVVYSDGQQERVIYTAAAGS